MNDDWRWKRERLFVSLGVCEKPDLEGSEDSDADKERDRMEADILAKEEAALDKEVDWILQNSVPNVIKLVKYNIQFCMELLKEKHQEYQPEAPKEEVKKPLDLDALLAQTRGGARLAAQKKKEQEEKEREAENAENEKKLVTVEDFKKQKLVEFKGQSSDAVTVIRGILSINGCNVSKAELQLGVKPTWGRTKQPFTHKCQISHLDPLRLPQLRNTNNFLELALLETERLVRWAENTPDDKSTYLERVLSHLHNARQQLLFNQLSFPSNIQAPTIFIPPIPQDVILEVGIASRQLVITVIIIQLNAAPDKLGSILPSGKKLLATSSATVNTSVAQIKKQGPSAGDAFIWQNKRVEVMDVLSVAVDVPVFGGILQSLHTAIHLCSELRDKLIAIS